MRKDNLSVKRKFSRLSAILFATVWGFVLACALDGEIIHSIEFLADKPQFLLASITLIAFTFGLGLSGYFIKTYQVAQKAMAIGAALCAVCGFSLFIKSLLLWHFTLPFIGFASGVVMACLGFWFKYGVPKEERINFIADVLIYSTLVMMFIDIFTVNFSYLYGVLVGNLLILLAAFTFNKVKIDNPLIYEKQEGKALEPKIKKAFFSLYIFIVATTTACGLFNELIFSKYFNYSLLRSTYRALPYILTLFIFVWILKRKHNINFINICVSLFGFSFVLYSFLGVSVWSLIAIFTIYYATTALIQLYEWEMLGELIENSRSAIKILGYGLSAFSVGYLITRIILFGISFLDFSLNITVMAIAMILIITIVLPYMQKSFKEAFSSHRFIQAEIEDMPEETPALTVEDVISRLIEENSLTERESEILRLIVKGKTYKAMGEELFVSENTVKFHVKNIYSKLDVHSKSELNKKIEDEVSA